MKSTKLTFMLCSILWFGLCSGAKVDTIEVQSSISEVNVFYEGARITRNAQTDLAPGKYALSVRGLPLDLDRELIKVRTPKGIRILAVSHRVAKPSQKSIQGSLDALGSDRDELNLKIEWLRSKEKVFSEEEDVLIRNIDLKKVDGSLHAKGVRETADFYRERLTELAQLKYENTLAIRNIQRQIKKLNQSENELMAGMQIPYTQLFLFIEVEALNNGKLGVEYFTNSAGWNHCMICDSKA